LLLCYISFFSSFFFREREENEALNRVVRQRQDPFPPSNPLDEINMQAPPVLASKPPPPAEKQPLSKEEQRRLEAERRRVSLVLQWVEIQQ
jgi:hypothetical protein